MYRVHKYVCGAVVAAVIVSASAAGAVGVTLDTKRFDRTQAADARAAMAGFLDSHTISNFHSENFEGLKAWDGKSGARNPQNTAVGSFNPTGATGSGHSVIGAGDGLRVRNDAGFKFGRYNTNTPSADLVGGNWLDSNDNQGIEWKIEGVGKFNTVSFFVVDAADVGGKFSVEAGGQTFSDLAGGKRLANGNIQLITLLLDEAVTSLTINMGHHRNNDGFAIDGASIGNIAPVPLPPAVALLFSGIAAMAGIRRRRKVTAA